MIFLFRWLCRIYDWFDLVRYLTLNGSDATVEFNTSHPSLLAEDAPHESRGVIRAYRAGWLGPRLCELLGVSQATLTMQVKHGLDEEGAAQMERREIYDARIPKGAR